MGGLRRRLIIAAKVVFCGSGELGVAMHVLGIIYFDLLFYFFPTNI